MSSELHRTLAENGSLMPRADNILRGLQPEWLHHEAHESKHPLTIYQISLDRIAAAWLKVFPLFSRMELEIALGRDPSQGAELLGAYEGLLQRLNEHADACEEILRCLHAPIEGKIHRMHWQFLDAINPPGWRELKDGIIKRYRDPCLGLLVNELKHASGHLTLCNAKTTDGPICGFFLNGAYPGGALGPSRKLHKSVDSMRTAFSFRRDMMMNFWLVYQMGESLAKCIESTIKHKHGDVVKEVAPVKPSLDWSNVCMEAAALKGPYFPDEEAKEKPVIVVPPDGSSIKIKLRAGSVLRKIRPMDIKIFMTIREGTPGYVLPYYPVRKNADPRAQGRVLLPKKA
ncbi:hypothetical protein [Paraburkholderia tropica]|uniref:hypothetical protein n=1 Tax=Paraburkholderia tropica TaxID=92647 RepID=UPI002AAFC366|nr:hypothetical protein [Paraburkholderia tropica]